MRWRIKYIYKLNYIGIKNNKQEDIIIKEEYIIANNNENNINVNELFIYNNDNSKYI